jgi:uncharacterized protein DUF559
MLARMAPRPLVPRSLTHGSFTTVDARNAGLTPGQLRGASWRRIGPATYIWKGLDEDDRLVRLRAVLKRLPPGSAFSGLTAAWLHGIDVGPCDPIEAIAPVNSGVSARSGIRLRRATLDDGDVASVREMPTTSLVRTLADLSQQLSLTEAVVIADAALHSRRVRLEQLRTWAGPNNHRHGVRKFRSVINLAEPRAESPMESRLRMLLILAGLPRPAAQVSIYDRNGRFVGRPDLYYEEQRLGIEYDGASHRDSLAEDNRRQNLLLSAGVSLVRFTAGDVLHRSETVASQVATLLDNRQLPANGGFAKPHIRLLPANRGIS